MQKVPLNPSSVVIRQHVHLSGTGTSSALQGQKILIWMLLNSGTKNPDWLTNTMHCSFFSAHRECFHICDFSFSLKME